MRVEEIGAELRWYWRESHGELGLRSNFTSMVARLEGGAAPQAVPEVDGRRLEAARRARRIARRLEEMPAHLVRALWLVFAAPESAGLRLVAIDEPECVEAHVRSRSKRKRAEWYDRLTKAAQLGYDIERRRLWIRIQAAADKRLCEALDAYRRRVS